ncbi:MAG: hypothetical protein EPO52_16570 [Herbiconiux sp.]|uniref:hypothetical protein n=1 Tax=Herbiconiux sp. TaxID=1871186 RepID=UPI0011F6C6D9|nr:hypothetical protein [Herbiconiux sp.]TAJ46161.1 MAG: hypothetical protein EPO52_16570 [Herbiconiux sp.]
MDGMSNWLFDAGSVLLLAGSGLIAGIFAARGGRASVWPTAVLLAPSATALLFTAGSFVVFWRWADLLSLWS